MRSLLGLFAALVVGCSLPVDDFKSAPEGDNTVTEKESRIVDCEGLPTPNRFSGGHCYFAAGEKLDGESAARACAAVRNAHLVTIGSAEQAVVTSLAEQLSTDVWIGLRAEDEEAFGWVTGENEPFRAWGKDYPKEDGGSCVISRKDGRWENRKCSDEFVALCEL